MININGPHGIRRRAGAMSTTGVGGLRTPEDNETRSLNEMFMFIYVPTVCEIAKPIHYDLQSFLSTDVNVCSFSTC